MNYKNNYELKKRIQSIDWSLYNGPDFYDSLVIVNALLSLVNLNDSTLEGDLGDKLISAIGNNHAGTYYPAVLSALDIIIYIEKNTSEQIVKNYISAILNDLYYFKPDMGDYNKYTANQLELFVKKKLSSYSD